MAVDGAPREVVDSGRRNNEDVTWRLTLASIAALVALPAAAPLARSSPPVAPQLAFVHGDELRIVGADGTNERTLDVAAGPDSLVQWDLLADPSWSPTGDRVAYAHASGANWVSAGTELRIARVDGSGRSTVVSLPGTVVSSTRWSPDGKRLAFVLYTPVPVGSVTWGVGSRWDIYVVDVDGSGLRPLAPIHPIEASSLDWSPDGEQLAFVSDAGGLPAVYTIAADDPGLPVRVSPVDLAARHPRWSPDGARIAFTGSPTLQFTTGTAPQIWTVRSDGSGAHALRARTWEPPTWSPDGQWLAYACSDDRCGLNIIRLDNAAGRTLTNREAFWPVWSRRGQIAFASDGATDRCCVRTLWVINRDGSGERKVTDADEIAVPYISWSK